MKYVLILSVLFSLTAWSKDSTKAPIKGSCEIQAPAVALSTVVNTLVSEGTNISNIKFQASEATLSKKETLNNNDILEIYDLIVYVFDGKNIVDGVEFPAVLSVKVVLTDLGAAFCMVKSGEVIGGDEVSPK